VLRGRTLPGRGTIDIGGESFNCDSALKPGILGAVDLTHAPGTDEADDLVGTQSIPSVERLQSRKL
jgi:hypothetical protein